MTTLLSHSPSATTIRSSASAPRPPARFRRARLLPAHARSDLASAGADLAAAEAPILPSGLRPELMPRHVGLHMDGNRRWARARGLPAQDGHVAMARNLELIVGLSRAWGVRAITAFLCSLENLRRNKAEVENLMWCCERFIADNIDNFSRQDIRLQVIGDTSKMPGSLRRAAAEADEATRHNSQLHVMLAFCYTGQWDMAQACRELARAVRAKELSPDDIDESLLAGRLATRAAGELSDVDLFIRTGGELRLSNFLLWQVAYAEFFFTDKKWPDFGAADYLEALRSFQSRDRRFGL